MLQPSDRQSDLTQTLIGEFKSPTGHLVISDPCYRLDTWCSGKIENAVPGTWLAHITSGDVRYWGARVLNIIVQYKDYPDLEGLLEPNDPRWIVLDFDIGVDSGQAGIFDKKHYKDDEVVKPTTHYYCRDRICEDDPWYSLCCDRTLNRLGAGTIPYGAVASSGYGDGSYVASCIKDAIGSVIAVKIDFINPEDL